MGATCWNVFANEMAVTDGATAPPRPDTDPDDVSWIKPPTCPKCGAFVRIYPTTYDRWVSLAAAEIPAKDVPEPFRWRLMKLPDLSASQPTSRPYGSVESIRFQATSSCRLTA